MIVDKIENAHKYYSYSDRVKQALEYIKEQAEAFITMEPGRYEVDGKNLYALVLDRPCDPDYDAYWEGHRNYLDIHYVADGEEWFGYNDVSNMKEISYTSTDAAEFAKYEGEGAYILLKKGDFCLTDLADIHAPSAYRPNAPFLKKVCVKVRL